MVRAKLRAMRKELDCGMFGQAGRRKDNHRFREFRTPPINLSLSLTFCTYPKEFGCVVGPQAFLNTIGVRIRIRAVILQEECA